MTVSIRLHPRPAQVRERCALCQKPCWPWLGQELCQRCEAWVEASKAPPRKSRRPVTYV
jgi:hypothetical protein